MKLRERATERLAKGIKATLPGTVGQALQATRAKRRARLEPKPAKPRNGAEKRVPDADPHIEIRLDTAVTAGPIQDRYDVEVAGEVIAERPIQSVSLVVDGVSRASFLYGQSASSRQAFSLVHAERETARLDLTPIEIEARTDDGTVRRTVFTVAAGLNGVDVPRVVDGPVRDIQSPPLAAAPVRLYVETAACDRQGVLNVVGWSVALSHSVDINIFVGDQLVGTTKPDRPRDDIGRAFPAYANARTSGFTFSTPISDEAAPDTIAVEAIDPSGARSRVTVPVDHGVIKAAAPSLPDASATEPAATSPRGKRRAISVHCDETMLNTNGDLFVSGWAVSAVGIATISVRLDGEMLGNAELGLPRPDVGERYPSVPEATNSGFRLRLRTILAASGDHQIDIQVQNKFGDIEEVGIVVKATDLTSAESLPGRPPADGPEFRFSHDYPVVIDGAVPQPVNGRLAIEGWAVARTGIEAIDIFFDGQLLGQAYYGTARRDVEAAFPGWMDAFHSGYIFHVPPRVLESGVHTIRLQLRAKGGDKIDSEFRIDVQQNEDIEDYTAIRRHISRAEANLYQDILDRLACLPNFRIMLTLVGPFASEKIAVTIRSLVAQTYGNWQLLIVADDRERKDLLEIVDSENARDRVSITSADAARGKLMSASTNRAPCLVAVLSPGDQFGCDALAEIAVACGLHPKAQFIYADEDRVSPTSHTREPYFKPDWSPDLLLSTNYIGRPWFATARLLRQAGITPHSLLAPAGHYDAVLRCTELATGIHHVPKLLCRRDDADVLEPEAERRMLEASVLRRNIKADVLSGCLPGTWRLKRTAVVKGKVSIIIPTRAAKGYIATCLETLRSKTAYRNFEIICIDNIPSNLTKFKRLIRKGADKVVAIPEAFNWSRFNNQAVRQSTGQYLLFLNDDIEIQREDWLDALLEHAQRPEVGVVGPQLLYPDRKVQHAGIFLTTLGAGRHSFRYLSEDDPGYFGLALTQRNVSAVTGACMLMRRDVFNRLGRFDEAHAVINNDVDFCLRSWQAGLSVVYTPHAQLIHHELASRANIDDIFDTGHFAKQWRTLYATGDPYFSPRLTKLADDYRPDTEPARLICPSKPLFRSDEIKRILAVKLDHIGDLITALPALRRLRQHFPMARIYLLASGAAKAFLSGESCVDELIEFEFFHTRSGLGQKELTQDDFLVLGERLQPYRFDLALDLRKQIETRHVLQYVPARLRAGYNYLGRFPWLDIALEWEGDIRLTRKQSHISEDLLRLVDTIAAAGESVPAVMPQAAAGNDKLPTSVPAAVRALFRKPVVAVHPGVGAIMRQWLPEYFATVIDLLIEKNQMNVVLVGGHDEVDLAEQVLDHIVNRKSVVSLAGKTSLEDLTGVLRACALYLGNNSGPQHIAAALGVPTIGIYSGVVDAAEWGPTGARAIALQRSMVCSPCYLIKPDDCPHDMACLKRLEPAVVHSYCEMMLAKKVPGAGTKLVEDAKRRRSVKRSRAAAPAKPIRAVSIGRGNKLAGKTRLGTR
jgi:O-antigen biosynthesis protein